MNTLVNIATLSTTHKIVTKDDKKVLSELYLKSGWKKSKATMTLEDIIESEHLMVIRTDNVSVIDFDDDGAFNQALEFNDSLAPEYQCGLIIKSMRHGGHFYYLSNDTVQLPDGHTKQQVLDILVGSGHNVIAPSKGDAGKMVLHRGTLTKYNSVINTFVSLLVLQHIPQEMRTISLRDGERYSDDAADFIKAYLSNLISQEQFHEFYGVQNPIPEGGSNEAYLSLSTRLASDETINIDDYLAVMEKFNKEHQRKTESALRLEITDRMVKNTNGLWRYDKNKLTHTFTTIHRRYKTKISAYFNIADGSYLIHYLDGKGVTEVHTLKNVSSYIEIMEKISQHKKDVLRRKTADVTPVEIINDYKIPAGYDFKSNCYNKAFINSNLTAFTGTKPSDYTEPTRLLDLMRYMWGEEFDYLLSTTKHRYSTFQFSPVVTFLKGTEGSGKDLTVALLTAGFSSHPQNLNYQLLKDKHSNWQTEENAVFSEIGSWKSMERADLLTELKTISGSNGNVTFRDMQKTATVVPTLIKIWITANEWVKLHTDPLTQRRVHVVYMPHPLEVESGGNYSSAELTSIISNKNILDFYYWLGNVYHNPTFTVDHYKNAISRQKSEAYDLYLESTQSKSDLASTLLWEQNYDGFVKILEAFSLNMEDFDFKYNKAKNLVISVTSLKNAFARNSGNDSINKTIDRIASEKDGNKRLKFNKNIVEKYITIYEAPEGLDLGIESIEGVEE